MFPVLKPFRQNLRQCRFGHDSNPLLAWHTCSFLSTWDASHTKFRTDSAEEDEVNVARINSAGTVWVRLGCPKQERWMAAHRCRVNAVMIGVGAVFDYHAGTINRAPEWMQNAELEWLHRLCSEPPLVEALSCYEYCLCCQGDAAIASSIIRFGYCHSS